MHKDIDEVVNSLKSDLEQIDRYLKLKNLSNAFNKTKLIIFDETTPPGSQYIQISKNTIYNTSEAKLLGILWNYKLSWKEHIQKISIKAKKIFRVMKFISAHSWGAHPTTLLHVYKAYIRSVLKYASFIYHEESKSALQKLNAVQNNALRTISGCFKTTPINILHHICGIH